MSSPLLSLVLALQRQMSQENEGAPFIDDAQRKAVLRGTVGGFYAAIQPTRTVDRPARRDERSTAEADRSNI